MCWSNWLQRSLTIVGKVSYYISITKKPSAAVDHCFKVTYYSRRERFWARYAGPCYQLTGDRPLLLACTVHCRTAPLHASQSPQWHATKTITTHQLHADMHSSGAAASQVSVDVVFSSCHKKVQHLSRFLSPSLPAYTPVRQNDNGK